MNALHAADGAREWTPPSALARYVLPDCDDVLYVPEFQTPGAAEASGAAVAAQTEWRDESIELFGRSVPVPRRCAWYGDAGVTYGYSRLRHSARGWTVATASLRDELLARLGIRFNFVLLNLYRDGNDHMGWHSDDERDLGEFPCIASLSYGAPRRFCLRARDGSSRRTHVRLEAGSLLVMYGRSQRTWMHSLPRVRNCFAPRINLTFRLVRTDR